MPNVTPYSVAKAAQDTLTRNLALEFARKGVRINSVQPGVIPLFSLLDVHGVTDHIALNVASS